MLLKRLTGAGPGVDAEVNTAFSPCGDPAAAGSNRLLQQAALWDSGTSGASCSRESNLRVCSRTGSLPGRLSWDPAAQTCHPSTDRALGKGPAGTGALSPRGAAVLGREGQVNPSLLWCPGRIAGTPEMPRGQKLR